MIQFYSPDISVSRMLPESDSQHCVRVLRMGVGDCISVVDGAGRRHTCTIVDAHPKHTAVEIVRTEVVPLSWCFNITVAVAPTKHLDRMEWLVEKLTEIGVNRIVPVRCDRSERKEIKCERLEKIAVSAMKQSLKAVLPEISPMTPLASLIRECAVPQRFVAYCNESVPRVLMSKVFEPGVDTLILIGPEGDFSDPEIRLAFDNGFKPVSLGDNRLRTETAAIYACSAFHILSECGSNQV